MPLPGLDQVEADVPSGVASTSAFDELLGRILEDGDAAASQN
jgi:hypothetical protein